MAEFQSQLKSAQRRRELSRLLQQQGLRGPQQVEAGGAVLPVSPLQALAPLLQTGLGVFGERKADQQELTATSERNRALAEWLKGMPPVGGDRAAWAAQGEQFGELGQAAAGAAIKSAMEAPDIKYQDAGDAIVILENGVEKARIPKGISPDTKLRNDTTIRGQDVGAATAMRGQDITMRGQDLGAETAGAAQAVTARGQDLAAETARRGQDLSSAAASKKTTPVEQDAITKIGQVNATRSSLAKLKQSSSALSDFQTGPIAGRRTGGGFTDSEQIFSADVAAVTGQILAATKVPGTGAQSDRDAARLDALTPQLTDDSAARDRKIQGLHDWLDEIERTNSQLANLPFQAQPRMQGSNGAAAPDGPAIGSIEDGFRFKGGNPADPNSWEPAQ